ncbi:nucleotidyltransferase family protein [Polaribacter ponticola]|uniref:Nucleotidyltransferase family protein n=1 Tax=Polaribacter ponticola TaxID=2978475 RepID=A0ABT5SAA4_9FLAO|nr:nucleotidyltransferase family protein [Polaribacter sp. MSW5]MDD7914764.1 nucleotidyltransferase family protein [Polaribacter sp. MSW5]
MYCNLKRANFLHYLPEDLVAYMKHITNLNRERNQQIIIQAKEINELLLKNNITPIFLKGTGNLLEGLYEDVAERMVGDIDFIVSKEDYQKTIDIMHDFDYHKVDKKGYGSFDFKHYDKLKREGKIAAIEIHKELLKEKYADEFNYNFIINDIQVINKINVLSFKNQLSLTIIAIQINDNGLHFKSMALRNGYDVFLLSKKTSVKSAFLKLNKLQHPLNCFIAISNITFNNIKTLSYNKTIETEKYLRIFLKNLNVSTKNKFIVKTISLKLFIWNSILVFKKSIFDRVLRKSLIKKIFDKSWRKEKLIQLGLKKS